MGYWRRDCSESVIVLTFLARTCQVDLPAPDELDTRMFRGLPIMRKAAAQAAHEFVVFFTGGAGTTRAGGMELDLKYADRILIPSGTRRAELSGNGLDAVLVRRRPPGKIRSVARELAVDPRPSTGSRSG